MNLESLNDEESRTRFYLRHLEEFRAMADEANEEHRRGETRPLEELLGE